ncbi:unnamed protein product [Dibothriocephalus latus]|uniref:Uncharacterized protein n=1 Tax=Dibothriocephalus latus TaxID=60516 RepID=A0A3P7LYR4_DIBLA|nr:unnamed protein product [Dibothriocephalus latus]
MSVLYLVKRTFSAFDKDCFAKVFGKFVRPKLEFAIQARSSWTADDLNSLEKVQNLGPDRAHYPLKHVRLIPT